MVKKQKHTKRIHKTKSISKTNSKTISTKTPVQQSEYEWGLGIEHEFVPVIKCDNFEEFKDIYKTLNKIDLDEANNKDIKTLKNEMKKINNHFYFNVPVNYSYSYMEKNLPFANMEWTGDKHFLMLETKNMNYANVTLNTLLDELNKNTKTLLDNYNDTIKDHFKHDIEKNENLKKGFIEPEEGSIFYLYHPSSDYDINMIHKTKKPTVIYNPKSQIKLGIDTAGSYHFWITLPHKVNDDHKSLHQRAAYLLQSIEPLLIGAYCSPDPRIDNKTKKYLFAGSFRGAVNKFANYGTSLLQDYDSKVLFSRLMGIKNLQQPTQIDSDHYIFQIRNKYENPDKDKLYTDKLTTARKIKPQYFFLDDNLEKKNFISTPGWWLYNDDSENNTDKLKKVTIGLNIRRKKEVKGFEFRIMDHIPESELKNLAKIIYLFACMSYEIGNNNLTLSSSNKGWNTMIANTLFDGYKAHVDNDYITFLEKQFNVQLSRSKTLLDLLDDLVNKCWNKIQKNKKNGLWLILKDDKTKPEIISKNKTILDKLL
jgi:hypothetical protein